MRTIILLILLLAFLTLTFAVHSIANIDISQFDPVNILGVTSEERYETTINYAKDINGDGLDDILVGVYYDSPLGRISAGTVYVIFGVKYGLPNMNLTLFDNTTQGFRIMGEYPGDNLGNSVKYAGDFNGDGIGDIIVGAPFADPLSRPEAGSAYLIYGKRTGFYDIDLRSLKGSQGFKIRGAAASDRLGMPVGAAGDVNNDGYDDIIVGAPYADPVSRPNAGCAYIIFGKASGTTDIDVGSLTASQGITIIGAATLDNAGFAVSYAGDINKDGIDDIVIGAPFADAVSPARTDAGCAYVIFGQAMLTNINLASLTISTGFKMCGALASDYLGASVSFAGDVNGDGIHDLIVGAYRADPSSRTDAGTAYIVYGKSSGLTDLDMASFVNSKGFQVIGSTTKDFVGFSVSNAGDINGDGYGDVMVGAYLTDPSARADGGAVYIIYGSATPTDVDTLTMVASSTNQGFRIGGASAGDFFGLTVSYAGNVNGNFPHNIFVKGQRITTTAPIYVISIFIYWDNDQLGKCPFPLRSRTQGFTYCDYPCQLNEYLYWNGSCLSTCNLPLPSHVYKQRNFCDYPCLDSEFLNLNESCTKSCDSPFVPVIEASKGYCRLPSPNQEKVPLIVDLTRVVSRINSGGQIAMSILSFTNPMSTVTSILTKMIVNTRYINVTNPSLLKTIYSVTDPNPGALNIAPNAPVNIMMAGSYTSSFVFSEYNVGGSFLVNYWGSLISIAIFSGIFVVFKAIEIVLQLKPRQHFIWSAATKIRIVAQNFVLQQIYVTIGSIFLYVALEYKSQAMGPFIFTGGFIISIIILIFVIIILGSHFRLIWKYQKIKRVELDAKNEEATQVHSRKNAGFALLFYQFVDKSFFSQGLLLFFIGRDIVYNLLLATLDQYEMIQILVLSFLNVLTLYCLIKRKFYRDLLSLLQHTLIELMLVIINFGLFELAILGEAGVNYGTYYNFMGGIIIYCNFLCHLLSIAFILGKTILFIKRQASKIRSQGLKATAYDFLEVPVPGTEAKPVIKVKNLTKVVPAPEVKVQTIPTLKIEKKITSETKKKPPTTPSPAQTATSGGLSPESQSLLTTRHKARLLSRIKHLNSPEQISENESIELGQEIPSNVNLKASGSLLEKNTSIVANSRMLERESKGDNSTRNLIDKGKEMLSDEDLMLFKHREKGSRRLKLQDRSLFEKVTKPEKQEL